MLNFQVIGKVMAWEGDWAAELAPQHQLALAKLVMAGGAFVAKKELARAVWDSADFVPDGGVNRVVSELGARLRPALPDIGLFSKDEKMYHLELIDDQADVLRFRKKLKEARTSTDRDAVRLKQAALAEWGTGATGLYGGYPLIGLDGTWADDTRTYLRNEYRRARLECLEAELNDGRYRHLVTECECLAVDADTLCDERFLEVWMLASYRAGDRLRAGQIFRRAEELVHHQLAMPLGDRLRGLAERIKNEDPELGVPDGPVLWPVTTSPRRTKERTAMNENGTTNTTIMFTNHDSTIGKQIGTVNGDVVDRGDGAPVTVDVSTDEPDGRKP